MSKHMLIDGKYSRWNQKTNQRESYDSHDPEKSVIADLTEAELKSLGSRVKEMVEENKPADILVEVVEPIPSPVPVVVANDTHKDLLSKSVSEIRSSVANIADLQVLNAIREEEVAGKQRLGVLKVIRSRQEELNG